MLKSKPIAFITLVIALAASALTAAGASAAAPDAPWSATGTASTTATSDGTSTDPVLDYSVAGSSGSWKFSATASTARLQPVNWHYKGYHAWFNVRVAIEKFVVRDGTEIVSETLHGAGPVNCCASPSGGFDYTGTTTFDLQPGDVYGFRMSGSHYDSDRRLIGSLSLSLPVLDAPPPVITPPNPSPGCGGGAEEQTEFDVILEAAGANKIQVIKVIREITGLGLYEAKNLVESAPKAVLDGKVNKETAERLKAALEAAGASVRIPGLDAPPPVITPPNPTPVCGGGAAAEEQTEFDVILEAAGANKIQVIKVIRELTGLGLYEAKNLVDMAPKAVLEKVNKETAERLKAALEAAGASVSIK